MYFRNQSFQPLSDKVESFSLENSLFQWLMLNAHNVLESHIVPTLNLPLKIQIIKNAYNFFKTLDTIDPIN